MERGEVERADWTLVGYRARPTLRVHVKGSKS
jgi:hypothetical protein